MKLVRTKAFAAAAAIRAARTFLQAFLSAGAVTSIASGQFDWDTIGQAALVGLGGAVLSFLLSVLAGLPEADPSSPIPAVAEAVDDTPGKHALVESDDDHELERGNGKYMGG